MKTLFAIVILLIGTAFFIQSQYPQWLADYLPSTEERSPSFENVPILEEESPWIAAHGRVEPVSEERRLAFEISGLISAVNVREGDQVKKGDVLATLRDEERVANVDTAKAEAEARRAVYDKLIAGARKEEKTEAWNKVQRLKSIMDNAQREMKRRQQLLRDNLIAKEEVDRAEVDYRVAQREYQEAVQRHLITKNQSRKEDIAQAWSEYSAALKKIDEAESQLEKTRLRSPVDGTVLKKHRHAGENVSIFFESPVLTVADISEYQIRAEVDEKFAARVKIGQKAYFTSDTYGNQRFNGKVIRVGTMTGKKRIDTGSPQDKVDTKVLEVIIRLDDFTGLITGLTGDVFIHINGKNAIQGTVGSSS
ncbi:MAG: secretion protein HlyD [Desulfovibrio sp.]|nr:secretion protein HlyD [Desulfovibrio sp.]|tara:strand:+ start:14646 stop:15740 length:1095 start_codon:yes stop_codon:yes gene_type:complete